MNKDNLKNIIISSLAFMVIMTALITQWNKEDNLKKTTLENNMTTYNIMLDTVQNKQYKLYYANTQSIYLFDSANNLIYHTAYNKSDADRLNRIYNNNEIGLLNIEEIDNINNITEIYNHIIASCI